MLEIERKFLVRDMSWQSVAQVGVMYKQSYLSTDLARVVRVRLAGEQAFLTVKGKPHDAQGVVKLELEYSIPPADAQLLFDLCERHPIEKVRYCVPVGSHVWDVDVFSGDNQGLVLAEIELKDADEPFEKPAWLGQEVSHDSRYANARLWQHPYLSWA